MPVSTHLDRARNLTVIRTEGGCGYQEFEDALRTFYAHEPTRLLLAEFCAEGAVWSPDQVRQLIVFLAAIRHSIPENSRVAVVCFTLVDYGLARMGQTLSELRIPWTMEVFQSEEEGLKWLGSEA
jgi:hypothetical protein